MMAEQPGLTYRVPALRPPTPPGPQGQRPAAVKLPTVRAQQAPAIQAPPPPYFLRYTPPPAEAVTPEMLMQLGIWMGMPYG
jgi:hypothetical protein